VRESATTYLDAPPAAVLARITDIASLPEWNGAIRDVVERPVQLAPGSVWRVRLHAFGQTWVSKSVLTELDEVGGRFRHRSRTDDGNPSYVDWEWTVQPEGSGSRLTVTGEINPKTFWRKHLLVHLRRPALRREMRTSLAALSKAAWT
jgi:hypothetical protein